MVKYIKYPLDYNVLEEILQKLNKKRVNFFIDLMSIAKGFYNKEILYIEINHYIKNRKPSDLLNNELKDYLNDLYRRFKKFDPFFIIFYDNGLNIQNLTLNPTYKFGRTNLNTILENEEVQIFKEIKRYYFETIKTKFEKKDISKIFYLEEYESDFIPYFCIMNDFFDSQQNDLMNIILSIDKDLLQTCEFSNTIQCISQFKADLDSKKFKIHFGVFDNSNAISYFYKNFRQGLLTAEFIPLMLSISGDKSDAIKGIKGVGYKKSYDLIVSYGLNSDISKWDMNNLPDIIKNNITLIQENYKLISFKEQIKRMSFFLSKIQGERVDS